MSLYYAPEHQQRTTVPYTLAQLSEYISYAKSHVNPVITDEAYDELVSVRPCVCLWRRLLPC